MRSVRKSLLQPQSPRGFSAHARHYYFARKTKTAMLRRLTQSHNPAGYSCLQPLFRFPQKWSSWDSLCHGRSKPKVFDCFKMQITLQIFSKSRITFQNCQIPCLPMPSLSLFPLGISLSRASILLNLESRITFRDPRLRDKRLDHDYKLKLLLISSYRKNPLQKQVDSSIW